MPAVRDAVAGLVRARAYLSAPKNGWVTIYDEASDQQDDSIIRTFGSTLSQKLNTAVIACLVHDSDIAAYWLFDRGKLVDEFDSAPDYFKKATAATHARVRGRAEALLPLCLPGTTSEQVDSTLHPPDGPPLMAEDMLVDIARLLGIDEHRMSLGFKYFDEEAESILPDVGEFEPVGGAERKTPSALEPGEDVPRMPNMFAMAVGMMAHDFQGQLQQMVAGLPPGMVKPGEMLKKLRSQFDRSAREMLKQSPGALPSYEELKQARDHGPEALADLVAARAPALKTDIAVCAISTAPKEFIAALLKHGLDPDREDSRGVTPLSAAQHRPEILRMLRSGPVH